MATRASAGCTLRALCTAWLPSSLITLVLVSTASPSHADAVYQVAAGTQPNFDAPRKR